MKKRSTLLAVVLFCITASTRAADLAASLQPLIDAHKGTVAVAIKHVESGETFRFQADKPMPTASLIKLPLMVAAYQAMADGKLKADQPITLKSEDKVPGSGILSAHFSGGATLSLTDVIHLMIVYSDNTATNLVIDQVGLPATAELMEKLGYPNTKLHSKVYRADTTIFPKRSQEFGLGSTTADEMVGLLEQLAGGKLVSKQACEQMLGHLRANDDHSTFPRFFPPGTIVAHKTGAVSASRCDAGIIDTPTGPLILCVLTAKNEDLSWSDDNAAQVLCARIAEAAYNHFVPAGARAKSQPSGDPGRLKIGDAGKLVEALQRTLNARLNPAPDLGVDGDFGAASQAALMAFQRSQKLKETGETDPETWRALGTLVTEGPEAPEPVEFNARTVEKEPAESDDVAPAVTCAAWAMADGESGKFLYGAHEHDRRAIASTTKIVTAYLAYRYAQQHPGALDETVTFSQRAADTEGSTAALEPGESLSVRELMYGLLLPSGNDASVALAEHFGALIAGGAAPTDDDAARQQSYDQFITAMNAAAKELGMNDSHFTNTHGLPDDAHASSAADVLTVALAALKDAEFAKVVSTPQHGATVTGKGGYRRNVVWYTTNRLLKIEGYDGVKTGTTNAAGCCLVSRNRRGDQSRVLVVLGATSSDSRYADSRNLFRWAWGKQDGSAK